MANTPTVTNRFPDVAERLPQIVPRVQKQYFVNQAHLKFSEPEWRELRIAILGLVSKHMWRETSGKGGEAVSQKLAEEIVNYGLRPRWIDRLRLHMSEPEAILVLRGLVISVNSEYNGHRQSKVDAPISIVPMTSVPPTPGPSNPQSIITNADSRASPAPSSSNVRPVLTTLPLWRDVTIYVNIKLLGDANGIKSVKFPLSYCHTSDSSTITSDGVVDNNVVQPSLLRLSKFEISLAEQLQSKYITSRYNIGLHQLVAYARDTDPMVINDDSDFYTAFMRWWDGEKLIDESQNHTAIPSKKLWIEITDRQELEEGVENPLVGEDMPDFQLIRKRPLEDTSTPEEGGGGDGTIERSSKRARKERSGTIDPPGHLAGPEGSKQVGIQPSEIFEATNTMIQQHPSPDGTRIEDVDIVAFGLNQPESSGSTVLASDDTAWIQRCTFSSGAGAATQQVPQATDNILETELTEEEQREAQNTKLNERASGGMLEHWSADQFQQWAIFHQFDHKTRVYTKDDVIPIKGANPMNGFSPAQAHGCVWTFRQNKEIHGGTIADQVGTGKTRLALGSQVFERAHYNKAYEEWLKELQIRKKNPEREPSSYNHLPSTQDQKLGDVCPTAHTRGRACACQRFGGVHARYQPGPTLIFAIPQAVHAWVAEFQKLVAPSSQPAYSNNGFGVKDGFGKDDDVPFKLIVCHSDTLNTMTNERKAQHMLTDDDRRLLDPLTKEVQDEEGTVITKYRNRVRSDRLIILTTAPSYKGVAKNMLTPDLQGLWLPGVVIADEFHETKNSVAGFYGILDDIRRTEDDVCVTEPCLWTLSGTPFADNVFTSIGTNLMSVHQSLSLDKTKKTQTDWNEKTHAMYEFRTQQMKAYAVDARPLFNPGVSTTKLMIANARKQYGIRAPKVTQRLMIQRSEHSRMWGAPVVNLPRMEFKTTKCGPLVSGTVGENIRSEQAAVDAEMKKETTRLHKKRMQNWRNGGKVGNKPERITSLWSAAKRSIARLTGTWPGLPRVARVYRDKYNKALDFRAKELETNGWDTPENEQQSPAFEHLDHLMDLSPKMQKLKEWLTTWATQRSEYYTVLDAQKVQVPDLVSGLLYGVSSWSAHLLYLACKYRFFNPDCEKWYIGTQIETVLFTGNVNTGKLKQEWTAAFRDEPVTGLPANYKRPRLIVASLTVFCTGINACRAKHVLFVEPAESAHMQEQASARARRANDEESKFCETLYAEDSKLETLQIAVNDNVKVMIDLAMAGFFAPDEDDDDNDDDNLDGAGTQGIDGDGDGDDDGDGDGDDDGDLDEDTPQV